MLLSKCNDVCGKHFEHMGQESNRTRDLFTLFVAVLINKMLMHLWSVFANYTEITLSFRA
jgi:hypothetical protein